MSIKDLEKQIETDLNRLKEILHPLEAPVRLDQRLYDLVKIFLDNPGCFVTVAPTALKIRSKKDERLAKIDADFNGVPEDIGLRVAHGMRNKDVAYMFLLSLHANDQWKRVKFNYRNSQPRQKEITLISKLRDEIKVLCSQEPIKVVVGVSEMEIEIDGIVDVPNVPKADFAFTLNDVPCFYISHKDKAENATHSDSFRQYAGITKFCLGDLAEHAEILAFKEELSSGFANAGLDIKDMRKGSYFAKKIQSKDLILASIFGKNYRDTVSSIHNVDAVLHGDVSFELVNGTYVIKSSHQLLHPKYGNFMISEEFEPHLIVMKSTHCHQGFKNARIAIWPKNKSVVRGLANFQKFFIDRDYNSFKHTENSITPNK